MLYNFFVDELNLQCTNNSKLIISDSINYHLAHFDFSDEWLDYSKTVVFTNASTEVSIVMTLDEENNCIIPWEALGMQIDKINYNVTTRLIVAVHGFKDDVEIWTNMRNPLVLVKSDKSDFQSPKEPSEDIINQLIERIDSKGDSLEFEEETNTLKLLSGEKLLSEAEIPSADDYTQLRNKPTINGSELIGNYNEIDPTVGDWAKTEFKPTYSAQEIGAVDVNSTIGMDEIDRLFQAVFG